MSFEKIEVNELLREEKLSTMKELESFLRMKNCTIGAGFVRDYINYSCPNLTKHKGDNMDYAQNEIDYIRTEAMKLSRKLALEDITTFLMCNNHVGAARLLLDREEGNIKIARLTNVGNEYIPSKINEIIDYINRKEDK
jgi:hypothetical protein